MKLYLSMKKRSDRTHENYRQGLHRLCSYLDLIECELSEMGEEELVKIVAILSHEGASPHAISAFLAILQPFFGWYMLRRGVDKDELARMVAYCKSQHLKQTGEHAYPAMTIVQQQSLFERLEDPHLRNMVWASMSYGFRAQELCNLRVRDVEINESGVNDRGEEDWGRVVIRKSKGDKTRYVYVLPGHIPVWKSIFRLRELDGIQGDRVFYWDFKPLNAETYPNFFKAHIAPLVDFDITSHALRRTFATNLYRKGVGLLVIQNLLGHTTLEVTRRYLNILETETRKDYLTAMGGTRKD